ncbi:hypothetical protein [Desulfoscipio gibsoniae]|uniref:Uncharacterized protein n=1 Tax=Desulfoscipio gibsoniae DSM 7213 TaxID=767817 RepID=R4KEF6_9FIRM|nr:hypothetical protein [Desulfoscipio gibsoniae]AGL01558.1 hypothetical protein Desgi_2124 [Desulfoscipio gibsoniae DSM 7213]
MASPRLKAPGQGGALSGARVVAFIFVVLTVGFSGWLTAVVAGAPVGLASAIGGALAGVVGFFMLVFGSLYEVRTFTCPSCGQTDQTLKHIGSYNCFNCGATYYIHDKEIKSIGVSQANNQYESV